VVKRLLPAIIGALVFSVTMPSLAVAWTLPDMQAGVTRDTFPLTGFQLMMAGIVAVVLVGGGILLRRLSRPRKP